MEERLDQMSAVLQAMQKTLECNICLDLMNKPLTTKCGHSFCAECIHQVVKGPRSSAQCPLCMTNITRRSLGHNNKITNLVVAVRKIIDSIKKDCCFEVTPSKYRPKPRPRPIINPEDDDSENEENDEPRRGTRKRGVTSHYNPEVHVPKPRVKSAKQRILATDNGQELSLHAEVRPEKIVNREDTHVEQGPVPLDVISKEHSYSSPTKQEPVVRTSLIPTIGRGKGSRGGGMSLRGKGRIASGLKGKADTHTHVKAFGNTLKQTPLTYYGKKAEDIEKEMLSVSQQEKAIIFPGEAMVSVAENSDSLSEKLGRVEPADKVANWLTTSSEVGFRIGVTSSADVMSVDSEELDMKAKGKSSLVAPKVNPGLVAPKVNVARKGNKKFIYPNESLSFEPASTSSSSVSAKNFFRAKVNVNEITSEETTLPDQNAYSMPSQDDQYNFVPSQKTPKQLPSVPKGGQVVKPRARGMLKLGRGRVRGRGRGRGSTSTGALSLEPEGFLDDTRLSTVNITLHKQSTPLGKGNKLKEDINISMIKPPEVVSIAGNEPMESIIVQTHADIEDDHGIPDSCPVSTKDEFDVLVSEVKDAGKDLKNQEGENKIAEPEIDAEANLLFVTPAQGPDQPLDIVEKKPILSEGANQVAEKETGPQIKKKRVIEDSDNGSERSKRARIKKSTSSSSSDSESSHTTRGSKSKAEKAKEEVEALCSMFEEIETHPLETVSLLASEKEKKQQELEKEESMRLNITNIDKTLENTKLNRSVVSTDGDISTMPPPKIPIKSKKVKFHENCAEESNATSTTKENSSMATRSAGKRVTSRIAHNARYASEMKLIEPNKKVAMSVSVKDTKSPGWSHVVGARKDLKTRHTSLKITGGEQRNVNDSRTEGGTSVLSSKVVSSSEESEVTIDDQTQDFDVEHLCQSQTKKERVIKLKQIVSKLQATDTENKVNNEENKPADIDVKNQANDDDGEKDDIFSDRKTSNITVKSDSKESTTKRKGANIKALSLTDAQSKNHEVTTKEYELTKEVGNVQQPQITTTKTDATYGATQIFSVEGMPEENKIITPSETEPFECNEDSKRKSSASSISSSASSHSSGKVGRRLRQPAKVESKQNVSRLPRTSRQQTSGISKLTRKTFSLDANTQDLSSLHPSTQSSVDIPEDSQKLNTASSPSQEISSASSGNKATDNIENKAASRSDSSSVTSKTLPQYHSISPSTATQSVEDKNSKKALSTSPAKSAESHTNFSGSCESKAVPFKSIGPLCSKRCAEVGENVVTALGSSSRDLCLHAIPCEVYQVLMKYMTLLVTQTDNHSTCCGNSHVTKLLNSKSVQTSPVPNTTEEEGSAKQSDEKIASEPSEKTLSESDSQVVPNSCETQEMDIAVPLPSTGGVKTRARKEKDTVHNGKILEVNKDKDETEKGIIRSDASETSNQSSEIPLVTSNLLTQKKKFVSTSLSQASDSQNSDVSTSLLAAVDVGGSKQGRATRSTNLSCDMNSQPAEKGDRGQTVSQKLKEKVGTAKTMLSKNDLVEVEKENLKNKNTVLVAISRPRRKPLQSGQPVIENIMSQLTKEEKRQAVEKLELSQIQDQDSQDMQKSLSTMNRPASSKPLFASDESSHGNKKQKEAVIIGSGTVEEDHHESDNDSPLKSSIEPKRQNFKRIRRPSSGSSSEESDSDSVIRPCKRKTKSISSSDSAHLSGGVKGIKGKSDDSEQHRLDSEEMRDLERLDKNVWEFFGHPDEDLLASRDDDDKNSHVSIEDPSQNKRDLNEFDDGPLPSLPLDEDLPSTEDVLRNVKADLDLVKNIRDQNEAEPEVISLVSQDVQPDTVSTQKPTFSASTKALFSKVDKNLSKAENLLCSGKSFFSEIPTSTSKPKSNSSKNTGGDAKSKRDKHAPGTVSESDHDTEEDTENMSHSSAYSSQSEAISTQKREEVKDEVEMLKARVRELEAVVKKKENEEAELRSEKDDDSLPPTCPTEVSDAESEELFSSLPDLTKSTEPKLPTRGLEKKKTKIGMSGPPSLVCTGLNSSELSKVQELIKELAPPGTKILKTWMEGVTHVVVKTDEDRMAQRTLKYLYGVASGCWVIMLDWVLDSLAAKELQNEEEYEVLDCTGLPGPHRARTTITPLFHGCEFYLIPPFMDVSLEQLREMMEKCGARIVESPQKFSQNRQSLKLIVLQTDGDQETTESWQKQKKVCVAHDWIIECIGMYARICISPYIIGSPSQSQLSASCLPPALLEETQEL